MLLQMFNGLKTYDKINSIIFKRNSDRASMQKRKIFFLIFFPSTLNGRQIYINANDVPAFSASRADP